MLTNGQAAAPEAANQPCTRDSLARRLTTLRVGIITIRGTRELCLIRNISEGGLRAHVYSSVDVGEEVSVELKTGQQTAGSVIWRRDGSIGVQFDDKVDVEALLASHLAQDGGQRPRMPRVEVDRLGELRIGARLYPINTCDMSQGGVRIEIDHPLEVGEAVVLTLEKFRPVNGTVRWFREGTGGIAFNQVIPFHELMRWLRG
jgi:hypothetical protein